MQTEIQFLLDLVLNHKLPPNAKKACLERIGTVEAMIAQRPTHQAPQLGPVKSAAQLKYEMEMPVNPPAPRMPVQKGEIDRETGTVIVNTGNGTKGPKKW